MTTPNGEGQPTTMDDVIRGSAGVREFGARERGYDAAARVFGWDVSEPDADADSGQYADSGDGGAAVTTEPGGFAPDPAA
jgi:hypothetical protein